MESLKDDILLAINALENANSFAPCPLYLEALEALQKQLKLL